MQIVHSKSEFLCVNVHHVYSGVCSAGQETFGINVVLVSVSGIPPVCKINPKAIFLYKGSSSEFFILFI